MDTRLFITLAAITAYEAVTVAYTWAMVDHIKYVR
jgi:hypothetical protein